MQIDKAKIMGEQNETLRNDIERMINQMVKGKGLG
jgi:hypothetical protein